MNSDLSRNTIKKRNRKNKKPKQKKKELSPTRKVIQLKIIILKLVNKEKQTLFLKFMKKIRKN